MDTFEKLEKKYSEMPSNQGYTLFKIYLEEIDYHFNKGDITQREWSLLYQYICEITV